MFKLIVKKYRDITKRILCNLAYFMLGAIIYSIVLSIAFGYDFLYSWEHFHDTFLFYGIYILTIPSLVLVVILYLQTNGIVRKYKYFNLVSFREKYKAIDNYFLTLIGINFFFLLGQVFGGCVWQIPNIIVNPEYYAWRRYPNSVSWTILLPLYSFAFTLCLVTINAYNDILTAKSKSFDYYKEENFETIE